MNNNYRNSMFRQLRDRLATAAAPKQRWEGLRRAERVLDGLDPSQQYSSSHLHFAIAGERPTGPNGKSVMGEDARHDIVRLIEDVSSSASIPVEDASERVLTTDDLSEKYNVSSKTISRWRRRGLVGRWFVMDGRKRLGFLQSSVDRFVSQNRQQVSRGARFRRLSDEERGEIVEAARELARQGCTLTEVIKQLGDAAGRSAETIRYTIKDHDQQHPAEAVFAPMGVLDERTKESMYERYRGGATVRALARRFRRSEASVRRVIALMRARRIMELPLDYMPSEEFTAPGAEEQILGPYPEAQVTARKPRDIGNLPSYLASLYEVPLLTAEQEVYLFRKYNYLKFRAAGLREQLRPKRPRAAIMDEIERLYDEAVATKNQIVRANLRLVVSTVKRYVSEHVPLFDLISEGNESLMRAAEKFDYTRGFKFSTYATWAIKKNYARTYSMEMRHRDRFRPGSEELFQDEPEHRDNPYQQLRDQAARELQVGKILDHLPERERRIIVSRFGLTRGEEPKTLKEIATEFGVSKERIRQLEVRAMSKLREAAHVENIEAPTAA